MLKLFQFHGRANAVVNQKMLDILAALPQEELDKDRASYYRSISGILNHLLLADILWLSRFKDMPQKPAALQTADLTPRASGVNEIVWKTFAEFRADRERTDAIFVEWTANLEPHFEAFDLDYRNLSGQFVSLKAWQALTHVFNHQTHHRGQITQILDAAGVPNDFSSIHTIK